MRIRRLTLYLYKNAMMDLQVRSQYPNMPLDSLWQYLPFDPIDDPTRIGGSPIDDPTSRLPETLPKNMYAHTLWNGMKSNTSPWM